MMFYGLLAIFPGIAALVSIYGLFAVPASMNGGICGMGNSTGNEQRLPIRLPKWTWLELG